jgi:O-acetyl-ADP-ribose deacetylase (regulator of RNase III)
MNDPTSSAPFLAFSAVLNQIEINIYQGDIFQIPSDVIVNAANDQMQHGGGLALAMSQNSGPAMDNESRQWIQKNGKIKDGEVAWTGSYNLQPHFKKIIHAVGPQGPDSRQKQEMMFSTLMNSILKTSELGYSSIVFPALSVGIYNYPKDVAARIHLDVFVAYAGSFAFNQQHNPVNKIAFAIFQPEIASEFVNNALERCEVFHKMNYFGLIEDFKHSIEYPICNLCKLPMNNSLYQIYQCCSKICDVCFYTSPSNSCMFCNSPPNFPQNYQIPSTHRVCRKCFNFYLRNSNHVCGY